MAFKDSRSILEHIRNMHWFDVTGFLKLGLTFLPGKALGRLRRDIWLVGEYEDCARDNGYWLFRHIRLCHPETEAYYPILSKSSDYPKVQALGNTVEFGSLRHYVLWWAASKVAATTQCASFPSYKPCDFLVLRGLHSFKYLFLNHGVARGRSHITDGECTNYDALIAISESERQTIVEMNHQPPEKVHALGFCRHDNLDDSLLEPDLVLFMPTWRYWLQYNENSSPEEVERQKREFPNSEYCQRLNELINGEAMREMLRRRNLRLVFYLHGFAQKYAHHFIAESPRVEVARKDDYFVQDLLKRAAYLITDYSSVIFDFAYMKRPCCYWQFDAERFAAEQFAESDYYSYERDGFGPVYTELADVIADVERAHDRGFAMEDEYRRRVEGYFPSFGTDHCERTYQLMRSL